MNQKRFLSGVCALAMLAALQLPTYAKMTPPVKPQENPVVHFEFLSNTTLCFEADSLEKHLKLPKGELTAARVSVIPQYGTLMVDGVRVERGEVLMRHQLNDLCYVPLKDNGQDWFALTPVCEKSVCTAIRLSSVSKEKEPPKLQNSHCITAKNMSVRHSIPADSAAGLLVLRQGKKGYVRVDGTSYTYTPYPNSVGRDSFSLTAFDEGGRLSREAVVTVDIERSPCKERFEDMRGNPSEYAAMKLREHGILTGERVGNAQLFHPEKIVSLGEFLVLIEDSVNGAEPLPVCVNTGLSNDDAIPFWMKSYVQKAREQGLIVGSSVDLEAPITKEQGIWMMEHCADPKSNSPAPSSSKTEQSVFVPHEGAQNQADFSDGLTPSGENLLTRADAADLLLPLLEQ